MARKLAAPPTIGALGRFSEPALLVLASLNAGKKHGYAIILDVQQHSGQRLGPGTLYGALARLEDMGLIAPLQVAERGRRPYRITEAGRRALKERLDEFARYQGIVARLSTR
jgi:DNA-binding PadR family transcriptional regulator